MAEEQRTISHTEKSEKRVEHNRARNSFANILAIAGFIVLIVIVIWGLVHALRMSGSWFSGVFSRSNPALVITAPASVTSGIPFSISWKHETSAKGIYAFLYQCKSGLHMTTPGPSGALSIPCGAAFTVSGVEKKLSLTAELSGKDSLSDSLSIVFIPTAGTRVQSSTSITVNPATSATPITPKPQTPEERPATVVPTYSSPADLLVRITSASVDPAGNGVVTFDISNVGGRSTGTYYFSAQLPTNSYSGYTYASPAQASLAPGAHVANTLRFTEGVGGVVTISVDPGNMVSESNEGNNVSSQSVYAPMYVPMPTSYPPQYPQYPQPYPQYPNPYGY